MARESMLKGAIVGCSLVTEISHLPAWGGQKDVEIVALCDLNEGAARDMARRAGISGVYGDYARMLQAESLDFVDVCTPPLTHRQLTVAAMDAGLHVLVEKPMAATLDEADAMVAASRRHGVTLCVAHSFLPCPAFVAAKSLVDGGSIGDVVTVDSHYLLPKIGHVDDRDHWCHRLPGGVFGAHATHPVYSESEFLGDLSPVKAIARKCSDRPWVMYDELKVLLEGERGSGSFSLSVNGAGPSFTTRIEGTEGVVQIDHFAMTLMHSRHRGNRVYHFVPHHLDLGRQAFAGAVSSVVGTLTKRKWYRVGHQRIVQGFVASMRNGVPPPVTAEDGRETVRVLEEIWGQIGWSPESAAEEDGR